MKMYAGGLISSVAHPYSNLFVHAFQMYSSGSVLDAASSQNESSHNLIACAEMNDLCCRFMFPHSCPLSDCVIVLSHEWTCLCALPCISGKCLLIIPHGTPRGNVQTSVSRVVKFLLHDSHQGFNAPLTSTLKKSIADSFTEKIFYEVASKKLRL